MKKNLFLWLIVLFASCEFVDTYKVERSFTINEAKKKEVFIKEFVPSERKIIFNDSVNFTFEEIWIEYPWMYINQNRDIKIDDSGNGIVLFNFKNETNASVKRKGIEIFSKEILYSGFNNIYFELDNVELEKDTIDF